MNKTLIALSVLAVLSACTRVETGEVGLKKEFNGSVDPNPLDVGFHQSLVGSVLVFSAREVLVPIKGLKPVTRDKLPMEDIDVQFTYHVDAAAIPRLYTKYSPSYSYESGGEIYLLQAFIEQLVRSAVSDAIAKYAALEVNDKRSEIVGLIQDDVNSKIKTESLDKDVRISQIVFTNVSIPSAIVTSTQAVVTAQNAAKAAQFAADQAVTKATGEANAKIAAAKGEAESNVITAQAQARAITFQAQAIAAQGAESYLQAKAIEKWDGVLPATMLPGSAVPFLGSLPAKTGKAPG